jgi:hypothetical protein
MTSHKASPATVTSPVGTQRATSCSSIRVIGSSGPAGLTAG